jgi:translin
VRLEDLARSFHERFDVKMAAREKALPAARRSIRASANAIRAIHRHELDSARALMHESAVAIREGMEAVRDEPDVANAGFLQDAQKEYTEARITGAIVEGEDLPGPDELGVQLAPYLNGMAETIGELRRQILDLLRAGDVERSESLLGAMEDLYSLLVTIDYPDAITGNLRRSTDVARGIMEKTRGDLSISIVQRSLHDALERHAKDVLGKGDG